MFKIFQPALFLCVLLSSSVIAGGPDAGKLASVLAAQPAEVQAEMEAIGESNRMTLRFRKPGE